MKKTRQIKQTAINRINSPTWNQSFREKGFRNELIFAVLIFTGLIHFFLNFLNKIEIRQGSVINDPVLSLFQPINLTWPIFVMIYSSTALIIYHLYDDPERFLTGIKTYTLIVFTRMTAMYLLPLEPPKNMIPLHDPFVEFFSGAQSILTKDLFYSGHTATLFCFFLIARTKSYKTIFLVFTILMGSGVILQQVHYTVDVYAAPFFVYASYKIASIKIFPRETREHEAEIPEKELSL